MRVAAVDVQLLGLVAFVAGFHVHGAVVDDELRLGVERVVARFDGEGAARQDALEVGVQRVVGGRDIELAARDAQVRLRLDAVVARLDIERAAIDGYEALGRLRVFVRLDAVAARRQREVAVGDLHAVAAAQGILHRVHHVRAARDDEVVLRAHGMTVGAGHVQSAGAVQREVRAAEQRGVRLVGVVFKHVGFAVGQRVLRSVGQGDEALVGLLHVHGRAVLVVDGNAREHDLHLCVFGGLHHELPVIERARHHVHAFGGDGDGGAVGACAVAVDGCCAAGERDVRRGRVVVGCVLVAVAVIEIERRGVERGGHRFEAHGCVGFACGCRRALRRCGCGRGV